MNKNISPGIVYDNAGNSKECDPVKVMIDKSPPTCTVTGGNNSWTKNNVTVTGTCKDTGGSNCKVEKITNTIKSSMENGSPGTVYDNAGNSTICASVKVMVDKTPPTCTVTGGSNSWTNNDVTVKGTCTDTGSGCKEPNVSITNKTTMNTNVSPGTVYDKVGNSRVCDSARVMIDKTPPTITLKGTNDNYTLTGSGSDSLSGVSQYKWDNNAWENYTGGNKTVNKADGAYHTFYVKDKAGNQASNKIIAYKNCDKKEKEYSSWPEASGGECPTHVKTFKWDYKSKNCSKKNGHRPQRVYNFKEYGCNCSYDIHTKTACSGATTHNYTSATHKSGTATIYYRKDDDGGKDACNAKITVNSYVYQVCEHLRSDYDNPMGFHGWNFYSGNVPSAYNFSPSDYYTHNTKPYTSNKVSSKDTPEKACQKACELDKDFKKLN